MNLMTGRDGTKGSNLETAAVKPRRIAFTVDGDDGSNNAASRTISWRFELLSDSDGKQASWEEHMIRLLWSSDSCGVSHVTLLSSKAICPPPSSWEPNMMRTIRKDSVVEFTWESVSRQEFRLVAYSVPSPVFRQYDLWIDGVSFFDLEERHTIPQLRQSFDESKLQELQIKEPTPSLSADTLPHNTPISNNVDRHIVKKQLRYDDEDKVDETDSIIVHHADPADENRHPMLLGLSPSETRSHIESRAIDMAFKDDVDIPWSSPSKDGCSIEANALCDAYDLMRGNALTKETISANSVDRVTFVHDQLTQMVNNVRVGAMSPEAAARTIHSIQMITGLAEFPAIWEVTVVFFGLKDTTTSSELWDVMEQYGEIESAAVADVGRGFGFCSFRSSSSAWYSIQACRNKEVLLNGEPLCAMRIQNGNWLDPILLSPSTPERNKRALTPSGPKPDEMLLFPFSSTEDSIPLSPSVPKIDRTRLSHLTPKRNNLSSFTVTTENSHSISDSVSSKMSSSTPKPSSSLSPKRTPIRFLRKLFKSPKPTEAERSVDNAGAPLIPVLGEEESGRHHQGKKTFFPNDENVSEVCPGNIFPPIIIRDASISNADDSHDQSNPPIIVRRRSCGMVPDNNLLDVHAKTQMDDNSVNVPPSKRTTLQTRAHVKREEFFPSSFNRYENIYDCAALTEHTSLPCSPSSNIENRLLSPFTPDSRNMRSARFGLSPIKPKGLFSRRKNTGLFSGEVTPSYVHS